MRGRRARNLVAGVADEAGDDERGERIEDRHAEPRARPARAMTVSDVQTSLARLRRVGQQHLAAEPLAPSRDS